MIGVKDFPDDPIIRLAESDALTLVDRLFGEQPIVPRELAQNVSFAVNVEKAVPIRWCGKDIVELLHACLHRLDDIIGVSGERAHIRTVHDKKTSVPSTADHLIGGIRGIVWHKNRRPAP